MSAAAERDDVLSRGVVGLAKQFRAGETDPIAALDHYAARIERFNPTLNAFLHLRLEDARVEAKASAQRWAAGAPLSPIDGVPLGVKANIGVAGLPRHAGIAAYRDDIADADASVVAQLKAAGVVVLGVLNMHEGALGATTDNAAFGRCENPWKAGFTPGGSSGGSGAAVAAGLCAAALGSDTMGSVRIPSAYCGVAGWKPSAATIASDGVLALSPTLDYIGVHARNAEDLDAFAAVLTPKLRAAAPSPALSDLTIGVWTGTGEVDVDPEIAAALDDVRARLADAGATMAVVTPPGYAYGKHRRAGLLISEREGAAVHAARLAADPDGFTQTFRKLLAWGAARPAEEYAAALANVAALRDGAAALFQDVDAVLAPVAPQTAFPFDQDAPANQADFTAWANFCGAPAVALPVGVSTQGVPLAVQLIASPGADRGLLALAAQVQALTEPPGWPPGYGPD